MDKVSKKEHEVGKSKSSEREKPRRRSMQQSRWGGRVRRGEC